MKSPIRQRLGLTAIVFTLILKSAGAFLPQGVTTQLSQSIRTHSSLNFFFGSNNDSSDRENKELGFYPKLASKNTDLKFDSLATFIATWSKKFEDDRKGMGLTTPVKVFPLPDGASRRG